MLFTERADNMLLVVERSEKFSRGQVLEELTSEPGLEECSSHKGKGLCTERTEAKAQRKAETQTDYVVIRCLVSLVPGESGRKGRLEALDLLNTKQATLEHICKIVLRAAWMTEQRVRQYVDLLPLKEINSTICEHVCVNTHMHTHAH